MDEWTETIKGVELADKKSAVGPASRKCRTGRKQRARAPPQTVLLVEVSQRKERKTSRTRKEKRNDR